MAEHIYIYIPGHKASRVLLPRSHTKAYGMDHQTGAPSEEFPQKNKRKNARECVPTPKRGGGQTATLNQSDDPDTKPIYILQYSPTRYLSTSNRKQTLP